MQRNDGRQHNEVRQVSIMHGVYEYAAGSVLYEIGKTKVLCAVTLQSGIPSFLRGTKTGWLTAHYAMLPTATQQRVEREIQLGRHNARSLEISRLIGRSLRSILRLELLPDRTIIVDCDVLQADGSTRTAAISGSYLALKEAEKRWLTQGIISQPLVKFDIAAISVGILEKNFLLDPTFEEDSKADGDLNFVLTKQGLVIEMQGTAEKEPFSLSDFNAIYSLVLKGSQDLFTSFEASKVFKKREELFSIGQRLKKMPLSTDAL